MIQVMGVFNDGALVEDLPAGERPFGHILEMPNSRNACVTALEQLTHSIDHSIWIALFEPTKVEMGFGCRALRSAEAASRRCAQQSPTCEG